MRVIAGAYRGRVLKSLTGDNTRPTSAKVKESIFNMIGPYFTNECVLDLYAGSGALAIEAVSRGCSHAYCVDKNYQAITIIKQNIQLTKEPTKFTVVKSDAERALAQFAIQGRQFDLVFLDPPYAQEKIAQVLEELLSLKLVTNEARVVCEVAKGVSLPQEVVEWHQVKQQHYGGTDVYIYKRSVEEHDD